MRIPAPRSRGCSLPRSTAQSHSRPLRSFPLPAHLQFHPAPVKSLHARSHLKFLCMPNTCRFSTEALGHTVCAADVERVCCVTAAEKSASLLFCRGAAVAVCLDRAPDTRVFRRQCGCSNLLTYRRGKENQHAANPLRDVYATQPISYKELTATSVKIEHIFISLSL